MHLGPRSPTASQPGMARLWGASRRQSKDGFSLQRHELADSSNSLKETVEVGSSPETGEDVSATPADMQKLMEAELLDAEWKPYAITRSGCLSKLPSCYA